mgnify:CR=1 FL=1
MKMSQLKMVIREVVREEIRSGLKDIIGELKQPTQIMTGATGEVRRNTKSPKPKKRNLSKNPVLNEILNETAVEEWKTMGGGEYTSDRMGELVGNSYKDLVGGKDDGSGNANGSLAVEMGVNPNDPAAAFLKKDYRKIMDAVDKKQGK